jgi:Glycogen recognition site of AMP-activated protein kinase
MRRARLIPLCICLTTPRALAAQWQASGELGVARLEQTRIPRSTAETLGATIDGVFSRALIRSTGLLSATESGRLSAQAGAIATLFGPLDRRVRWELSAAASRFDQTGAQTASSAEALGRLLFGVGRRGAAVGLAGGTRRADAGRQPFGSLSLGGWQGFKREQVGLDIMLVRTTTRPFDEAPRIGLNYGDASANWRHDQGRFSIGAVAGVRVSNSSLVPNGGWGSVDASVWLGSHVALVAAGGRSPQDVIRGVPRVTYGSIALRVTSFARPSLVRPRPRPNGPRLDATREYIEVRADSATQVELMGDFTDWLPIALERRGDVWRIERELSPGLHRLMIRIDGGEWTTPMNLPRAKDELGGVVGLVTVP